jgi:hypothetical protein
MKHMVKTLILITCITLFSSCAGVQFYKDADLKNETGIKVFSPKPYLLVSRTNAKDKPVEISINYLPDLSAPQYVKMNSGLGSSNITFSLKDGMLVTYGLTTDSKIPETISSIAGLLTGASGSYKTIAEALKIREDTKQLRKESIDTGILKDISKKIVNVISDFNKKLIPAEPKTALTGNQEDTKRNIIEILDATK